MPLPLFLAADAWDRVVGAIDGKHLAAALLAFAIWQGARWLRK